jgi:aminoglycoside/choline kinase family phosphotransferase
MGLQRHLKAIGIFSRLQLRDNKLDYLDDIPRTLKYICQICAKYPQLAEFNHYLNQEILPAYK